MSRRQHIGHLPSTLDHLDNENQVESILEKTDNRTLTYNLRPGKTSRLSVTGNSIRLRSIKLTDTSEEIRKPMHLSKKPKKEVPEKLTFRRKLAPLFAENPFEKYNVPDLVISEIFTNLRKRDLGVVMQVCRKFYAIGNISHNWMRTDVAERPVTEYTIRGLMLKNIEILRLSGAKQIPGVHVSSRLYNACLYYTSRLEILDLSRAKLSHRQLMMLLKPSTKLKCLSLEGNMLDNDVAECVSLNRELRQLDISMTEGLTLYAVTCIFSSCRKLVELNASWCGLNTDMLYALFENLTRSVKKMNLSGSVRNYGLNDEHIIMLVEACPNVVELDISDNQEVGNMSIAMIRDRWNKLETLSINRCYGIDPTIIVHLADIPALKNLNAMSLTDDITEKFFAGLVAHQRNIKVNKQLFNYTAKPITNTSHHHLVYGQNILEKKY